MQQPSLVVCVTVYMHVCCLSLSLYVCLSTCSSVCEPVCLPNSMRSVRLLIWLWSHCMYVWKYALPIAPHSIRLYIAWLLSLFMSSFSPVHPSDHPSVCFLVCLSFSSYVSLDVCPFACFLVWMALSSYVPKCLSVHLFHCVNVHPYGCLSMRLSIHQSAWIQNAGLLTYNEV